jgi:hypothetical protein
VRSCPCHVYRCAATLSYRREWVSELQRALFRPTDAAQALQEMLELQDRQLLCSRAQERVRSSLSVGTPESIAQANRVIAICRAIKPEEHCGDRVESLMLDLVLAESEKELLALLNSLTLVFVKEYAPPFLRDRLVRVAMSMFERSSAQPASAPWTEKVQQEFGLVLHAIAMFDHAARLRSQALSRQLASKRAAALEGTPAPSERRSDSVGGLSQEDEDFGLVTSEDVEAEGDCLSLCSCECATCIAEADEADDSAHPPAGAVTLESAPQLSVPSAEDPLKPLRQPRAFDDDYVLGAKLGEGAYSTVYRGCHRETGAEVAVKVAPKARLSSADISRLVEEVSAVS